MKEKSLRDAALSYAKRGWAVFPLQHKSKFPLPESQGYLEATTDPSLIRAWWEKMPQANIGISCDASNLVVIDLDAGKGGRETWAELCQLHDLKADTITALTGGGGLHLLFQKPDGVAIKSVAGVLGEGVDVKADGGYIVAPPSVHPNGNAYIWEVSAHPDEHALAPLPEVLLQLLKPKERQAAPELPAKIGRGTRNALLTSLAGTMRRRGATEDAILAALLIENNQKCDPPLPKREIEQIARSVARYTPGERPPAAETVVAQIPRDFYHFTDIGNGQRLTIRPYWDDKGRFIAPAFGDQLMAERPYVNLTNSTSSGRLFAYQNGAFRPAGQTLLRERCAALLGDSFTTRRFNEVLAWVETQSRRDPEDANRHFGLLNCKNGMVDWRTGELLPHSPNYLSTVQFPVSYDPEATCPKIQKFLDEVLPPDCIETIEELVGYCVEPITIFERAAMFEGCGANGKSVMMRAIEALLGPENVSHVPLQALGENRFAAAQLQFKLLNVFPDLDSRAIRSSGVFKGLVSGDPIMAERKNQQPFTLRPHAKLMFSANELPRSWDVSEAFFRRWLIIPFPNVFEGEDADTKLLEKLTTPGELSGFLNVSIQGLRRLFERGRFETPSTAEDALALYRLTSDPIRAFLVECCSTEPEESQKPVVVGKDTLYRAYTTFCEKENLGSPDSRRAFNKRFQQLYPTAKEWRPRGAERVWVGGVRLLPEYAIGLPGYTEPLPGTPEGVLGVIGEIPF